MGIELPDELADVAAATGLSWPEADEDALREQAGAWREAQRQFGMLAGAADTAAEAALGELSGQAGDAARDLWSGFVAPEGGRLTEAVQGAGQAADRLEHAAEQVGTAKVEMVRQLVDAAKNRDAAQAAADAGHPEALLGLDTVLRGTATNLGAVTEGLAGAVGPAAAAPVSAVTGVVDPNPGAQTDRGQSGLLGAVTGLPPAVVDAAVPGTMENVAETGEDAVSTVEDVAAEPVEQVAAAVPVEHAGVAEGGTGPVRVEEPAAPARYGGLLDERGFADVPTPPSGFSLPTPGLGTPQPQFQPPAQTTAAGFSDAGAFAGPAAPPPAAPPQHAFGQPAQGFAGYGGGQGGAPAGGHAAPPLAGGARPPAPGPVAGFGPPAPAQGGPGRWAQPAPAPQHAPAPRPMPPPVQPVQPVHPQPPQEAARPPRQDQGQPGQQGLRPQQPLSLGAPRQERESVVALFLVHMFPIGHLPVASDRPARQLPAPPPEQDFAAGLRFPPHDHPRSADIDAGQALEALRQGRRQPAPPPVSVLPSPPEELTGGYDPLGDMHERDWDHRFLVHPDEAAPEYAWPPGELYPEGGRADGEPVLLSEGALLDRFGGATGRVFAEDGTAFAARSLPPTHLTAGYRRYRVLRELPMWRAQSAAWFGQPGGGLRYRAIYSAAELVTLGYLADITFEER